MKEYTEEEIRNHRKMHLELQERATELGAAYLNTDNPAHLCFWNDEKDDSACIRGIENDREMESIPLRYLWMSDAAVRDEEDARREAAARRQRDDKIKQLEGELKALKKGATIIPEVEERIAALKATNARHDKKEGK